MNILLIGPRGCGKSTVGRLLAQRLNRRFIDLDERVLAMFPQRSVVEVWATLGEQAWRDAETRCLREALSDDDQVIALGGGVVMIPEAQTMIDDEKRHRRVKVVYLRCSLETLHRRLNQNPGDRPPLTKMPVEIEVANVLAARESTYLAVADVVVDGDRLVGDVVEALSAQLA